MEPGAERLTIDVGDGTVSALWLAPPDPRAVCVHGHGSGAPMTNPFHVTIAAGLKAEGIATLRYNFPYMENGTPWPDPMELAMATVAAAYRAAFDLAPAVPHF